MSPCLGSASGLENGGRALAAPAAPADLEEGRSTVRVLASTHHA